MIFLLCIVFYVLGIITEYLYFKNKKVFVQKNTSDSNIQIGSITFK